MIQLKLIPQIYWARHAILASLIFCPVFASAPLYGQTDTDCQPSEVRIDPFKYLDTFNKWAVAPLYVASSCVTQVFRGQSPVDATRDTLDENKWNLTGYLLVGITSAAVIRAFFVVPAAKIINARGPVPEGSRVLFINAFGSDRYHGAIARLEFQHRFAAMPGAVYKEIQSVAEVKDLIQQEKTGILAGSRAPFDAIEWHSHGIPNHVFVGDKALNAFDLAKLRRELGSDSRGGIARAETKIGVFACNVAIEECNPFRSDFLRSFGKLWMGRLPGEIIAPKKAMLAAIGFPKLEKFFRASSTGRVLAIDALNALIIAPVSALKMLGWIREINSQGWKFSTTSLRTVRLNPPIQRAGCVSEVIDKLGEVIRLPGAPY